MALSNVSAKWRRISSICVFVFPFITLWICFTIAKIRKVYTGGLAWPFFSDIGRDKPGYYVFVTGLTCAAIVSVFAFYFNAAYQKVIVQRFNQTPGISVKKFVPYAIRIARFLGMISTIGLPVLTLWDTANHEFMHHLGARWFFLLQLLASIVNAFVSYQFYKMCQQAIIPKSLQTPQVNNQDPCENLENGSYFSEVDLKRFKKIVMIQLSLLVIFFLAFLFYIPLGDLISGGAPRLTVEECLKLNLGETYCEEEMRLNEKEVTVRELNGAGWQVRSICQLICILTLLGYSLTFTIHNHEIAVEKKNTAEYLINTP
jgi:hypothetical protein